MAPLHHPPLAACMFVSHFNVPCLFAGPLHRGEQTLHVIVVTPSAAANASCGLRLKGGKQSTSKRSHRCTQPRSSRRKLRSLHLWILVSIYLWNVHLRITSQGRGVWRPTTDGSDGNLIGPLLDGAEIDGNVNSELVVHCGAGTTLLESSTLSFFIVILSGMSKVPPEPAFMFPATARGEMLPSVLATVLAIVIFAAVVSVPAFCWCPVTFLTSRLKVASPVGVLVEFVEDETLSSSLDWSTFDSSVLASWILFWSLMSSVSVCLKSDFDLRWPCFFVTM